MPDDTKKPGAFQAVQPTIPGVPARAAAKPATNQQAKRRPPYLWAAGGGAILILTIALIWWVHGVTRAAHVAPAAAPAPVAQPAAQQHAATIPVAPGKIATISEMKEPWSTREFFYRYPNGNVSPALLVHLRGESYWAISLREPDGTCRLEFASVEKLRNDYNLAAQYPMIGDPCTHTVYDLTRYGNGPNGLVRGAIVAGVGDRPPLAVEVQVEGGNIVASRSE